MPTSRIASKRIESIALTVALVAGMFSLTVATLMGLNWHQEAGAPVLSMPVMDRLRAELRSSPNNDTLKQEIRALDRLVRQSFFSDIQFRRVGGGLLAGGFAVTLGALHLWRKQRRVAEDPKGYGVPSEEWDAATVLRRGVAIAGLTFALVVVVMTGKDAAPGVAQGEKPPTESDGVATRDAFSTWPAFRGPGGRGLSAAREVPAGWDAATGSNILWSATVEKPGFSSAVVWGRRVWVTGANQAGREVYCFDADSGTLLWERDTSWIPGAPTNLPEVTADTGYAASTPAVDAERVYAIFATAELVCFDHAGKSLWGKALGVPENPYGHAASLLAEQGTLYVPLDSAKGGRMLAIDGATGRVLWDVRREVDNSWASPVWVEHAGGPQLILNGSPLVISHDPRNGHVLWSLECMGNEVAASIAFGGGRAYAVNEHVRLAAIDLTNAGVVAWEHGEDLPDVSSPVATDRALFMASANGVVSCLDGSTGALRWRTEFDRGFYASPIIAEERVYVSDMDGVTRVLAAGVPYRAVGEGRLAEGPASTAAIVDGRIYLRSPQRLYCIAESEASGVTMPAPPPAATNPLSATPRASAIVSAGDGPDWPIYRGDSQLSGRAEGRLPDSLEERWAFKTGAEIRSSPIIVRGRVFVGSSDSNVYSLALADGRLLWRQPLDGRVEASPLFSGGRVVVGTMEGTLYSLDAETGAPAWEYTTGERIMGGANAYVSTNSSDGCLVVGSYDHRMHAVDPATGKGLWTYDTGNYINGTAAVADGRVVFGGCDAKLHVISVSDGKDAGAVDMGSYVPASPAVAQGWAYVGHYDNALVAVDLRSRRIAWEFKSGEGGAPFFASPALGDGRVIAGAQDGWLFAVSQDDGRELWRLHLDGALDGSPVLCGNRVLVGSAGGRLYLVDSNLGKELWSRMLGAGVSTSPAVGGGHVVVALEDGYVRAFAGPAGR